MSTFAIAANPAESSAELSQTVTKWRADNDDSDDICDIKPLGICGFSHLNRINFIASD